MRVAAATTATATAILEFVAAVVAIYVIAVGFDFFFNGPGGSCESALRPC